MLLREVMNLGMLLGADIRGNTASVSGCKEEEEADEEAAASEAERWPRDDCGGGGWESKTRSAAAATAGPSNAARLAPTN